MDTNLNEIILKYLQVILTWPVITFTILLIFIVVFKKSIGTFISALHSFKGKVAGVEFEASKILQQNKEVATTREISLNKIAESPDELVKMVTTDRTKAFENYKSLLQELKFERIYGQIYGTQIDLLDYLNAKPDHKDNMMGLSRFYSSHVDKVKNLYRLQVTYSPYEYLQYLILMGLLKYEGHETNDVKVNLTQEGVNFLDYIKNEFPGVTYKNRIL